MRWLGGGFNELAYATVDEDPERVAIGVHQTEPPVLDEHGRHLVYTLEGHVRRAMVRLEAPLGERLVVDALTGQCPPSL